MNTKILSAVENEQLEKFFAKCVRTNATFPSERVGINNVTVQQLFNERTVDSLRQFGKFVNSKLNDYDPDFSATEPLRFGQIEAQELVDNLKLMIRYKQAEAEQAKVKREMERIDGELEALETPQERKEKLLKRKQELLGTAPQA